jgi:AP-1 complex subunit mu
MAKLNELEELGKVSPVIQDETTNYIYVQYSNLYLLALARTNVNAAAVLAFLHKLIEIFKHYFREVRRFRFEAAHEHCWTPALT